MSDITKYVFDYEQLGALLENTKTVNENLTSAFGLSKEVFNGLVDTIFWKGLSKDQFQAYYHLIIQYHGLMIGESVPSVGQVKSAGLKGDPCQEAQNALKELIANMDEFFNNCGIYKELENA